jgi:hypothetical protein
LIDWSLPFLLPVLISGSSNPDQPILCGTSQRHSVENWPRASNEGPKNMRWQNLLFEASCSLWTSVISFITSVWSRMRISSRGKCSRMKSRRCWRASALMKLVQSFEVFPKHRSFSSDSQFERLRQLMRRFQSQFLNPPIKNQMIWMKRNSDGWIQVIIFCPANECHSSERDWPSWIYGNRQDNNLLIQLNERMDEWVDEWIKNHDFDCVLEQMFEESNRNFRIELIFVKYNQICPAVQCNKMIDLGTHHYLNPLGS